MAGNSMYAALGSDDAVQLLVKGVKETRRRRYRRAVRLFERALAKDGSVGIYDKAYFHLGMSYAQLHADDRARLALSLFVDRAGVRDVTAYRVAEATLSRLGVQPHACRSTDPVAVYW